MADDGEYVPSFLQGGYDPQDQSDLSKIPMEILQLIAFAPGNLGLRDIDSLSKTSKVVYDRLLGSGPSRTRAKSLAEPEYNLSMRNYKALLLAYKNKLFTTTDLLAAMVDAKEFSPDAKQGAEGRAWMVIVESIVKDAEEGLIPNNSRREWTFESVYRTLDVLSFPEGRDLEGRGKAAIDKLLTFVTNPQIVFLRGLVMHANREGRKWAVLHAGLRIGLDFFSADPTDQGWEIATRASILGDIYDWDNAIPALSLISQSSIPLAIEEVSVVLLSTIMNLETMENPPDIDARFARLLVQHATLHPSYFTDDRDHTYTTTSEYPVWVFQFAVDAPDVLWELLLQEGLDVNVPLLKELTPDGARVPLDERGNVMHVAFKGKNVDAIRRLFEAGARMDITLRGATAVQALLFYIHTGGLSDEMISEMIPVYLEAGAFENFSIPTLPAFTFTVLGAGGVIKAGHARRITKAFLFRNDTRLRAELEEGPTSLNQEPRAPLGVVVFRHLRSRRDADSTAKHTEILTLLLKNGVTRDIQVHHGNDLWIRIGMIDDDASSSSSSSSTR